jgi:hypothetical protein
VNREDCPDKHTLAPLLCQYHKRVPGPPHLPGVVVFSTKLMTASFAIPSFQDGSGSVVAQPIKKQHIEDNINAFIVIFIFSLPN